jgi:YD repeat-containing protein
MTFLYDSDRLVKVFDDDGHVINFEYKSGKLARIVDETEGVLVEYKYDGNKLVEVIDRFGHSTKYHYNSKGLLDRVELPLKQTIDGQIQEFAKREIRFEYERVKEDGERNDDHDGNAFVVSKIIDAEGGITTFNYDFNFAKKNAANGGGNDKHDDDEGHRVFIGGTTTVTDALGNKRAFSNEAEFRAWRVEHGFYEFFVEAMRDHDKEDDEYGDNFLYQDPTPRAEFEAILQAHSITYSYDGRGYLTEVVDPLGFKTTYAYDAQGNLTSLTDRNGFGAVTSDNDFYRALRAALGFADAAGLGRLVADLSAEDTQALLDRFTSRFTYDAHGNLLTRTDNEGHVTSFTYTSFDKLERETSALGHALVTLDDAFHQDKRVSLGFAALVADLTAADVQAILDLHTSRNTYDANQNLIEQVDASGNITRFEYDVFGNRIRQIVFLDPSDLVSPEKQQVTRFFYDAFGNNIETIDAEGNRSLGDFDHFGNLLRLVDPNGGVTTYTYDKDNRLLTVTDAEGNTTVNAYDAVGNRIAVTNAKGHTVTQLFDRNNLLIATIDPSASDPLEDRVTRFEYDAVGNLVTRIDALGRVTQFELDADYRVIVETAADGVQTHYDYDAEGNVLAVTRAANTPEAATRSFIYNRDNQLIAETDPLGNTTVYAYDANHSRTLVTDPNGHTTAKTYDADNRVIAIRDPEGNVIQFRYDAKGNRVQVIEAGGGVRTNYFNANNQVVLSVDAEGFATSFVYDGNGNVVSETLHAQALSLPLDPDVLPVPVTDPANDRTTQFAYDKLNQVITRIDAEGFRTQFVYDAVGNRIETRQELDRAGTFATTRSFYDEADREIANLTAEGYLTSFAYDAVGNRIKTTVFGERVAVPLPGSSPEPVPGDAGRVTRFEYDANDRLIAETSPLGIQKTFEYDARGNRIAKTDAAGTPDARRTEFSYDAADRLIETRNALGVVTRLLPDADGNVIARVEAADTPDERISTFEYDANHRLVREVNALGVVSEFSYDASGNLTQRTSALGLSEVRIQRFEYDLNNRLVAEINGENERIEFAYDGAGNRVRVTVAPGLLEQQVNEFEYDRANQLRASIDGEGVRTEFRYDGAGNKIETIQAAGLPGQERHSFYDYDLDNRLISVTDPQGGITTYEYDVLGNQTRIVEANGNARANSFDALGRLTSTTTFLAPDESSGVVTAHEYDRRNNIVRSTQSFLDGSDARTTDYAYDLLNRQVRVTDAEDFSATFTYDAFGNQTRIVIGQYLVDPSDPEFDPNKAARAQALTGDFIYDRGDRLIESADGGGNRTRYSHDAFGNQLTYTEAAGLNDGTLDRTTVFVYDKADRLIEKHSPVGGIVRSTYDETGDEIARDLLQSADGGIEIWIHQNFEYDRNSRLTAEIDGEGVRTERAYDAMGNQVLVRFAAGVFGQERVLRSEFNLNNVKVADIDALGNRTDYAVDEIGNRIRATDTLGRVTRFYHDGLNQLIAVLGPDNGSDPVFLKTLSYDSAGNVTELRSFVNAVTGPINDRTAPTPVASPLDRVARNEYDGTSNLTRTVDVDGTATQTVYDSTGKKLAESTLTRTQSFAYDLSGRLVLFTDVDGTVTQFAYDAANNRVAESVGNPSDPVPVRTTLFEYDLANRLISQTFDPTGLKITQSLTHDKLANVVQKIDGNGNVTRSRYDLNNRLVEVIIDPDQADPLHPSLAFRLGGLALSTRFTYDAVGNQVSVTDARGNTFDQIFDANNRVIREEQPLVEVFTIDGGFTTLRPTTHTTYDAAGNVVQVIDPNGHVTTNYYDADDQLVAVVNADNVLREFAYDGAGDQISETLYMTRLVPGANPAQPFDPAVRPTPPAGEVRTITREYDLAGRLTRQILPAIAVTTVTGADTGNPIATRDDNVHPETRFVYDAFGNVVESFDANGNRTVAYYDGKNRLVAQVDATGHLIELGYDNQDNVVEQRIYATPLDLTAVDPAQRPAPPPGDVHTVIRRYDAANRLVEEQSAAIPVFGASLERVVTTFTYDDVGNQISRTLATGTNQETTEFFYYDADNRQVAVVNAARVLHTFEFDANGNQTSLQRFINPVPIHIDLATANLATIQASVLLDPNNDQTTNLDYDATDRLIRKTELMGPGPADDISIETRYNANGSVTWRRDPDGFLDGRSFQIITRTEFDGLGRVIRNISANGSASIVEFDAAGNQILVFTGDFSAAGSAPTTAKAIGVTLNGDLSVSWDIPGGNAASFVVWDVESRVNPRDYAFRSAEQATWFEGSTSATITIPVDTLGTNRTAFFRVVSRDIAGNLAWTEERSVTVPPRPIELSVERTGSGELTVTVRFETGAQSPVLNFGSPGNLVNQTPFMAQPDGSFTATIPAGNAQAQSFEIVWLDAAGKLFRTREIPFEAAGDHFGLRALVSESSIVSSLGIDLFEFTVAARVPNSAAVIERLGSDLVSLTAEWRIAGGNAGFSSTGAVPASGIDPRVFELVLGAGNTLVAGNYEVFVFGTTADGRQLVLDRFELTTGNAAGEQQSLSLNIPRTSLGVIGDAQVAIVDGLRVDALRTDDGRLLIDPGLTAVGSVSYDVFYGSANPNGHSLNVNNVDRQFTTVIATTEQLNAAGEVVSVTKTLRWNHDFATAIDVTLAQAEVDNIAGDLQLAWRGATGGTVFPSGNIVALTRNGTVFSTELGLSPGDYDIKVFYTDGDGREVIVEWQRINVADALLPPDEQVIDDTDPFDFAGIPLFKTLTVSTGSLSFTGNSVTVLARESEGEIELTAAGVLRVDPGLYTGEFDIDAVLAQLTLGSVITPGSIRDAELTNGLAAGYFTRNEFNAVNARIGTNADDGLLRVFGVDAKGNVVATFLLGDPELDPSVRRPVDFENPTAAELAGAIDTYAVYDGRDRQIATIAERVNAVTNSGVSAGRNRAVTRFSYDFADRVIEQVQEGVGSDDHRLRRFVFDAAGNLLREESGTRHRDSNVNDIILSTRALAYDRLGKQVSETDGNGHTRHMEYDLAGRLVAEIDALGNRTEFTNDAFGRETAAIDPRLSTFRKVYDQRDRLVQLTDALGGITRFDYDKNDNWIRTIDANNHQFLYEYDELGRVVHTISFQNGVRIDERARYDAFGNLIAEIDGEGRTRTHVFGGFARLEQEIDEGNRVTVFQYDRFRRIVAEANASSGKNISKQYDAAGRLLSVVDHATGVSTFYTYDIHGQRKAEVITTPGNAHNRSVSYQYDSLGRRLRWADGATGLQLNYRYDAAGNQARVFSDNLSVDHRYVYDANDRVTEIKQQGITFASYTYDAAGNRVSFNDRGTLLFTYTYDANDRVTSAVRTGGSPSPRTQTWTYDKVGNILTFNDAGRLTAYEYFENNRLSRTNDDGQLTTLTLDRSGRVTRTVLRDKDNKTFTFVHTYTADGRELSVRASGSDNVSGNSTSVYDANDKLIRLNLGQSGAQERAEFKTFVYNNDGQILFRFHDDGENDTPVDTRTEFLYANGHIVGETGNNTSGATVTLLDNEPYSLVQNIDDEFPTNAITRFTVQEGDTLQSIAAALYGNPSLWFIIAEANGLTGSEPLKAGTQLQIPNTIDTGRLTADAFVVYKEGDIIGSTLPNLKAPPPPPPDKCAVITAIILIVVIAIVVAVAIAVTAGAAFAAIAPAGAGIAAIVGGLLAAAAIGAAFGFVGGVLTQAVLVGFGLQEEFNWRDVAASTVVGAFTGVASGLAKGIEIGVFAARMATFAKVAIVAVEVSGEATRQFVADGQISSWSGLAVAGIGGALRAASAGTRAAANVAVRQQAARNLEVAVKASSKARNVLGITDETLAALRSASKNATAATKITDHLNKANTFKLFGKIFGKYEQKAWREGSWDPGDWGQNGASTVSQTLRPDVPVFVPDRPSAIAAEALAVGAVGSLNRQSVSDVIAARIGQEVNQRIPFSPEPVTTRILPQPAMVLEDS